MTSWSDARQFLLTHARLVDRRRFLGDADAARHAVLGYRNADGGFGHALEADVRSPHSQPLACEAALRILAEVGTGDVDLEPTCNFLATLGTAVPILLPTINGYPKASHWGDGPYEPHVNPTASIAGYLHALGVRHPWLDGATDWTFETLERDGAPAEAHAVKCALVFLEHVPDRARADPLAPAMVEGLRAASWYRSDPDDPEYGVTPLEVVPRPDHPFAGLFDRTDLDRHLDRLERDQQPDGGWPITWDAPGTTSVLEWRGEVTLRALRTLESFGRVTAED